MKSEHSGCFTVSLLDVIGIVFVILKLTNLIDWSWWLVLSPFLLQLALVLVALLIFLLIGLVGLINIKFLK